MKAPKYIFVIFICALALRTQAWSDSGPQAQANDKLPPDTKNTIINEQHEGAPRGTSNLGSLRQQANLCFCNSDYEKAESLYTQILSIDPHDTRAYDSRAKIRLATNNYSGALEDYSQVLKLDPNAGYVYSERGFVYCMSGDREKAKKEFDQLVKTFDPSAKDQYYSTSALAYVLHDDFKSALVDYNEALRIAPLVRSDNTNLYLDRAYVELILKNYALAPKDYAQAIKNDPDNEDAACVFAPKRPVIRTKRPLVRI